MYKVESRVGIYNSSPGANIVLHCLYELPFVPTKDMTIYLTDDLEFIPDSIAYFVEEQKFVLYEKDIETYNVIDTVLQLLDLGWSFYNDYQETKFNKLTGSIK